MSCVIYACAFGHQSAYVTAVWATKLEIQQRHKQILRTGQSTKCIFHVYFYQQAKAIPLRRSGRLHAFSPSDIYAKKEEESEKVRRSAGKRPKVHKKEFFGSTIFSHFMPKRSEKPLASHPRCYVEVFI
jgi:hypothetical protein